MGIQKVDTEETDRVEEDKDKGKDNSHVCRSQVVFGDLRSADGQAELMVNLEMRGLEVDSPCKCSFPMQR